jgi:hypothetical protein
MTHNNSFTMSLITVASILVVVMSVFLIGRGETPFLAVENQLNLYPNIETIGVAASGLNLPKTAQLMYRQSGEISWRVGHPLVRIDDGRLIGSLFGLSPATATRSGSWLGQRDRRAHYPTR